MLGHKEHLGGFCRNRGPRAKCTSSTEPKGPLGPCNTSYGRSEGLHQCLWASKSMWAFCKCDLMVEQLAEGRAVLIPAALWSPGGHFPVACWSTCTRITELHVLSTCGLLSCGTNAIYDQMGPPTQQRHEHHKTLTTLLKRSAVPQPFSDFML